MEIDEVKKSDILNLIGYGMSKFGFAFMGEFGFSKNKSAFCRYLCELGLAKSEKAVFNRQDTFDPYFDNGRKGWYQRNQREHIKLYIDSLFGNEDAVGFANLVKQVIVSNAQDISFKGLKVIPTSQSKFRQLQETGKAAEFFFMNNYKKHSLLADASLEDARLWGDGYDFQMQIGNHYILAEVKGLRTSVGSIRMTDNEFNKALEYKDAYILAVVTDLYTHPQINILPNPAQALELIPKLYSSVQTLYYSDNINWNKV